MNRRRFLSSIPALAAAGWAGRAAGAPLPFFGSQSVGDPRRRLIPEHLGVQLYTLRDRMSEDVARTLDEVAGIGYREVEFAGLFGHPARRVAEMLETSGLRAPSTHVPLERLDSGLDALLDEAETLGHEWLVVPSVPGDLFNPDGFRRMAEVLNRAGEETAPRGIGVAFHNHDREFADLGNGETGMGILLERGRPGLVSFQLDLFWTVHAGEDPLAWFADHSGRFASVHAKDRTADGAMVAVGDGVIDFATVLAAGEAAGVRHVFIEHDRPEDSLMSVARSYRALSQLRSGGR
ncbi:MAG: sugar phosphate isomerase/epimerase [Gemmatimonadetes bacterium]|nr:sugar phosphate isomerase/epimerase [Gemmatimonadota bacterium]